MRKLIVGTLAALAMFTLFVSVSLAETPTRTVDGVQFFASTTWESVEGKAIAHYSVRIVTPESLVNRKEAVIRAFFHQGEGVFDGNDVIGLIANPTVIIPLDQPVLVWNATVEFVLVRDGVAWCRYQRDTIFAVRPINGQAAQEVRAEEAEKGNLPGCQPLTATPTNTPTATATSTHTATPTNTASPTATATATASNTPTGSATPTASPTATASATATETPMTATPTVTNTPVGSATPTATATMPTQTATATSTSVTTPTGTPVIPTPTGTALPTPTVTATPHGELLHVVIRKLKCLDQEGKECFPTTNEAMKYSVTGKYWNQSLTATVLESSATQSLDLNPSGEVWNWHSRGDIREPVALGLVEPAPGPDWSWKILPDESIGQRLMTPEELEKLGLQGKQAVYQTWSGDRSVEINIRNIPVSVSLPVEGKNASGGEAAGTRQVGYINVNGHNLPVYEWDGKSDLQAPKDGALVYYDQEGKIHLRVHRVQEWGWISLKQSETISVEAQGKLQQYTLGKSEVMNYGSQIGETQADGTIGSCISDGSGNWIGVEVLTLTAVN